MGGDEANSSLSAAWSEGKAFPVALPTRSALAMRLALHLLSPCVRRVSLSHAPPTQAGQHRNGLIVQLMESADE